MKKFLYGILSLSFVLSIFWVGKSLVADFIPPSPETSTLQADFIPPSPESTTLVADFKPYPSVSQILG